MMEWDPVNCSSNGPRVTRIGLGCWAFGGHGWGNIDDEQSVLAIRRAFERGMTFFDTADVYGFGKSEMILRKALGRDLRSVYLATKGGVRWDNSSKVWNDSSPEYLKIAVEASLRRLGIERIPLYYIHKPDDKTPILEVMRALLRAQEAGVIGDIGVSNFSASQLEQALQVAPVRAVQTRLNLLERSTNKTLLEFCSRQGVKLVAFGALADGLLTGKFDFSTKFAHDDHRSRMSAFRGSEFKEKLARVEVLKELAAIRRVTPGQIALRWMMDKYEFVSPLFGAKTVDQVDENLGAVGWRLTEEEIVTIEAAFPDM